MPSVIDVAPKDIFDLKNEAYDPAVHQPGEVKWYFYDYVRESITEEIKEAWTAIRCSKGTQRTIEKNVTDLKPIRRKIEKYIKNSYLKDIQAPIGSKPELISWMEIH